MMGECEFLNKWNICTICRFAPDRFDECHALKDFRKLFESPQFKKQYAKLSVVKKVLESLPNKSDDFVRDVMDEIEVVGRTE